MQTKICAKCEKKLPETEEYFYKRNRTYHRKDGSILIKRLFQSYCIECEKIRSSIKRKTYYENNKEIIKKKNREYREKNPDKVSKSKKIYRKKYRGRKNYLAKKQTKKLSDSYVKARIKSSSALIKNIPHELIEMKRLTILLKREIR